MTFVQLARRSALFHWRTNVAVILGIAAAVSVLTGALIVGDSVRGSLRELALGRLGRTDTVLASAGFFRDDLAADIARHTGRDAAPLIASTAIVTHEPSGRRASSVFVYGVDERFWRFHGRSARSGVFVSPALAEELNAHAGDILLTRLQKPSAIPLESLFSQKEDVARTIRLPLEAPLSREELGEFSLRPQQGDVRAVFAPIRRLQRDLDALGRANTVLLAEGPRPVSVNSLRDVLSLDDLGVVVSATSDPRHINVGSSGGIVNEALETATKEAAASIGLAPAPVFTYLANTIRIGDRQIPYSLVTAIDFADLPEPVSALVSNPAMPIALNTWAAKELNAKPGELVQLEYYVWDAWNGLQTRTAQFVLDRIVPITGTAADTRLAPDYPGITAADTLADWDPPFPIDLSRVRRQDEEYWKQLRTTPKAFVPYERGRDLWSTQYGRATSIRLERPDRITVDEAASALQKELRQRLDPTTMGVTLVPIRQLSVEASAGATDFGEYFTYFSFFLVVSAVLLAVMFFRLGIEQRLRQIGILRASGFTVAQIRTLLLIETAVLVVAGTIVGTLGAIAYAYAIVYGLRTWWVGAVGTTLLSVHAQPLSLIIGAFSGAVTAAICVGLALRTVGKRSPRALLSAYSLDVPVATDPRRAARGRRYAAASFMLAGGLVLAAYLRPSLQVAAFFAAGALLLIASLFLFASWLRSRDPRFVAGRGTTGVLRLGFRGAAFRPTRSVLSAALIAAAAFIIVSVDAFRRPGGELSTDPRSGTGGFALVARTEVPIARNPNESSGREALQLTDVQQLKDVRFLPFRLRPGDDASCLNLYRPATPTLIAPDPQFIEANRFSFGATVAATEEERRNPWLLLARTFDDGAVPAIADATSLQYVLHAAIGDDMRIDVGGESPLVLRFVAALSDSVLQSEIVIPESAFRRQFPSQQGFRYFLVDAPSVRTVEQANALAEVAERELAPFGFDAVSTVERLEAFHRVENTYLSTFQALGGLGLLLGTAGLATVMFRNVLERRRELALLRAVGYDRRHVSTMMAGETAILLLSGLGAGVACACVAIAPAWLGRGGSLPGIGLVALLVAILLVGLASAAIATRAAMRGDVLPALRAQ
jgi:ABC-type antimicrobial peptide transport system permease subunit